MTGVDKLRNLDKFRNNFIRFGLGVLTEIINSLRFAHSDIKLHIFLTIYTNQEICNSIRIKIINNFLKLVTRYGY